MRVLCLQLDAEAQLQKIYESCDPLNELERLWSVREQVFTLEQNVSKERDRDGLDMASNHLLLLDFDQNPRATCRWRYTDEGVKIERCAVVKKMRSQGLGSLMLKQALSDIQNELKGSQNPYGSLINSKVLVYLHAQIKARNLYAKAGFLPKGDEFDDSGIRHIYMETRLDIS